MHIRSIEGVFSAFRNLRVMVVGDVMVDSYVWGNVERISPEAPVPIVHIKKREHRPGGAGNVALNCLSLGAAPILVSVTGKDEQGYALKTILKETGLSVEGILQSRQRITSVKERILSGSQQILRLDEENTHNLNDKENNDLLKKIDDLLPLCQVLIFEDYDKGLLNKNNIQEIILMAKKHGIPSIVDPKKKNFLEYENADLFKPNLKEIREGLNTDIESGNIKKLKEEIIHLKKKLSLGSVMVTLSEHGIFYKTQKQSIHIKAHKREIADVSGAGDTVVSIAGLCYALRLPARFIAELANLGGGLVCEHPGVVPIDRIQLLKEARSNGLSSSLKTAG